MVINFMLSTHCLLMNVLCPQPSIAAVKHSDDDDDDSWKLIKLISHLMGLLTYLLYSSLREGSICATMLLSVASTGFVARRGKAGN